MHILVTRHDKIGDFVTTFPMLQALKKRGHRVTVLVSKVNLPFARELPFVDDVLLYEKSWIANAEKIRAKRFDASISAFIDTKLAVSLFFARIPRRYAPATKIAQIFFNKRVVQRRSKVEKTEWAYNLDLAAAFDSEISRRLHFPYLRFDDTDLHDRVVLHPGFGGSSDGNLSLDDYLLLAQKIKKRTGSAVVFTFGPDDGESREYLRTRLDFDAQLLDSTMSLMEFCRYLAQSRLFISTSTGPMHLAGAVNTPTLSFFGDSPFASPKRWATISDPAKQHNFTLAANYDRKRFQTIADTAVRFLNDEQL